MSLEGTIIARQAERVVRVNDVDIEVAPAAHMVFFDYVDRPGVIGTVGTVLGEHDINIATMDVGRKPVDERPEGPMEALMCLTVDTEVPSDVLAHIAAAIEAKHVRAFSLPM